MRSGSVLSTIAALAMTAAPLAAHAATPLQPRATSAVEGEEIAGVSTVLLVVLFIAVGIGLFLILDDDDDDLPTSP